MVGGDAASVFHLLPLSPVPDSLAGFPDLLTPDDIFDILSGSVSHDPFRDGFSGLGPHLERMSASYVGLEHGEHCIRDDATYSTSAGAHKVNGHAAAVVAGTWARTVPSAENLTDFALVGGHGVFGAINCCLFASSNCWNFRGGERGAIAAHEAGWARAEVGSRASRALVRPAAVASAAAGGLGATLDVVWGTRAGIRDVLAAGRRAFGRGDAHAWSTSFAGARPVNYGALDWDVGLNGADPEEGSNGDDGGEVHLDCGSRMNRSRLACLICWFLGGLIVAFGAAGRSEDISTEDELLFIDFGSHRFPPISLVLTHPLLCGSYRRMLGLVQRYFSVATRAIEPVPPRIAMCFPTHNLNRLCFLLRTVKATSFQLCCA